MNELTWDDLRKRMQAGEPLRWVPSNIHKDASEEGCRILMLGNQRMGDDNKFQIAAYYCGMRKWLVCHEEKETGVGFYEITPEGEKA